MSTGRHRPALAHRFGGVPSAAVDVGRAEPVQRLKSVGMVPATRTRRRVVVCEEGLGAGWPSVCV